MLKENRRVSTSDLQKSVDEALPVIKAFRELLSGLFPRLSAAQRRAAINPPHNFPEHARKFAQGAADFPDLTKVVDFKAEAVLEDLDNMAVLYGLQREVDLLKVVLDDAVLMSGDEAYRECLALYGVGKPLTKIRPEVEELVRNLRTMFEPVRSNPKAGGNEEQQ